MNGNYIQIEINKYRDHIWSVDPLLLLDAATEISIAEHYPQITMGQTRKHFLKVTF